MFKVNQTLFSTLCAAGLLSLVSSQSFAAASSVKPDAFSGFYAGLSLGVNLNSISNKVSQLRYYDPAFDLSTDASYPSSDTTASASPIAFQLQGGWGKVFNQRYYYGGFANVGSANFSKEVSSTSHLNYVPFEGAINDFTATTTFTLKQSAPSYSVGAKFGYLLSPKVLLWGGVGMSQASFKLSASSSYAGTTKGTGYTLDSTSTKATFGESKSVLGVSYALGVEYHFLPRWNGFISDTLTNYNSMDFKGTAPATITYAGGGAYATR